MPTNLMRVGRWPDRLFFWSVLSTLALKWTNKYLKELAKGRY